jgi:hypothetical protein
VDGANVAVPGLLTMLVDPSEAKTTFSSMGPTRLMSEDDSVSVDCCMCVDYQCFSSLFSVCQPGHLESLGCSLTNISRVACIGGLILKAIPCEAPLSVTHLLVISALACTSHSITGQSPSVSSFPCIRYHWRPSRR